MTMTNDMHGTQSSLWQVGDDRSTHSNFDNGRPPRSTSLEWYRIKLILPTKVQLWQVL